MNLNPINALSGVAYGMRGFFAFLFALNYGGAAANPGVLPLMFVYFLYGFVSTLFLYSTLTFTRILALVWYAVFLIPVGSAWVFATKPST
jgi:hypothetical protein